MGKYFDIFINGYAGYAGYLWQEITFSGEGPWWHNYFWYLVVISGFFLALEWLKPWRKDQLRFRKDFWLDFFYMFFNFFIFSLIIYNAASDVVVNMWIDVLASFGITHTIAIRVSNWSLGLQLLTLFFVKDFVEWWIHRLLHRVPFLWEFHKVHHSVEQMGFAAHLRYHWMETLVYKTAVYLVMALFGFGIDDFFFVHIFTIAIGHWNHANFRVNIGPLKYILNNPNMHMWHHAYDIPRDRPYGMNFGISLSLWDYLFGTSHIPYDGRDIRLGFPGFETFPKTFKKQAVYGFSGLKKLRFNKIIKDNDGKVANKDKLVIKSK
ncbi:MAG: sterol desaturase family protein [Cyclobacteriaceae bacterium]|nr:sterol desaturase family protein [Cyclobacteriaceae bacterium]